MGEETLTNSQNYGNVVVNLYHQLSQIVYGDYQIYRKSLLV